jgi:hypothetical protein
MAQIPDPVPCRVSVRRVSGNITDHYIVIDLTHERDGAKHRTQVRLTSEQFALAVTGVDGVTGTVTGYTVKPKEPPE